MKLKEKLKQNKLTIGSWVTIGHHSIIEIMASAGFEWLTIDMEHSPISFETAQSLIATTKSYGLSSLVRVGKNDELIIKKVMDSGADGVIVPMVNSKEDAIKVVQSVYYPPKGKRGVGLARAQEYGIGFEKYKNWLNNSSVVIAQIEHIDAVNQIEEIISVEGIDGIIIGPYDLSASMGMPGEFDMPEVKDAINKVKQACVKNNFPLGFHVIKPEKKLLDEKINDGFTFLAFSLDFFFLGEKAREEMNSFKSLVSAK
ncbi:MAG: 2,4-dihydroxyhept-2-ene-1,7-dioic acid aldolase [Flavobacteriales bacterium]|nr:2,4-dihydroxyhept-2-ene-1,7-dioic acid aldolase [Flavobacteriales bacterium]